MDAWFLLLFISLSLSLSLSLAFALKLLLSASQKNKKKKLPPGPPTLLILAKILWMRKSIFDFGPLLRQLHARYGPIITLPISSPPSIFISDRRLAHQALIQKGAIFADRPHAAGPERLLTRNQNDVSSSPYGPLWRLLRRNLTSDVLHPSRAKLLAPSRRWILRVLIDKFQEHVKSGDGVVVPVESFEYAIFCLMVLMCFGEKPDEILTREIEAVQRFIFLTYTEFDVFEFFPSITKLLFRKRWNRIVAARRKQEGIFLSLIRTRQQQKQLQEEQSFTYAYVDSFAELEIPVPEDGGCRKLSQDEMVSLCSEFISAGLDTTTTALQWIMANIVKRQEIQGKMVEEIERVVGSEAEEVKEEDLQRMSYLKAVIMEGIRRYPPGHLVLPHAVSEEVELGGYVIPKGSPVNFEVAEMNWDGEAWEEPMEFRPERFLAGGAGEGVDITGSREIKMMTFGVGRRICPGLGLAMLHLEYYVANLVWKFEWKAVDGEEVDMTERLHFPVGMMNPLRAQILPRRSY